MKTKKNYKAYIASTNESKAFDSATGKTKESAIAAIKRRNSPSGKIAAYGVFMYILTDRKKKYEKANHNCNYYPRQRTRNLG